MYKVACTVNKSIFAIKFNCKCSISSSNRLFFNNRI